MLSNRHGKLVALPGACLGDVLLTEFRVVVRSDIQEHFVRVHGLCFFFYGFDSGFAIEACEAAIRERQLPVSLVDAEPLFDGRTLVFYFLGEPSAELDQLTERLAEVYEGQVQFRRFAEAVNTGCGPGCGTTAATGGCGNCAEQGCTIASACAASNGAGKRA